MQILITMKNDGVIAVPVNYNNHVQAAVFSLLSAGDAEYAADLHDTAYGGKTRYKFFTFGELTGKNHYYGKKLYYEGDIRLEVRSPSNEFIQVLSEGLIRSDSVKIGPDQLEIKKFEQLDRRTEDPVIRLKTLTPIVSKSQTDDNRTYYYSPNDVMFYTRIRETFESKYEVFCGCRPQSPVDILPVKAGRKVVTSYKNTWINAYHGIFDLSGRPEHLQFLYDVGLGTKTSLGFGMFEVVKRFV